MISLDYLQENATSLRERVRVAAERADRDPADITIVAVSKTFDRQLMDEAYRLGFRVFGESRVQEIRQKCETPLPGDADLHMIGPLQSNKIRQLLPHIQVLQTLDRESLLQALIKELAKSGSTLDVMIQVNVSGEEQKSGISPGNLSKFVAAVSAAPELRPIGFMTMAPFGADEATLTNVFGGLRQLRDDMEQHYGQAVPALSMGMSDDFEAAIGAGATHVRLGRSLFGER